MRNYKIVVYVPVADADKIREVLGKFGGGQIGNYDFTSFSVKGIGRFRPLKGANPAIGEIGKFEEVEEERIETIAPEDILPELMNQLMQAHPYEEPVIDIFELKNL